MAALRERFPLRRVARLLGWNLLILFALLLVAAGGAEVWLRATAPAMVPRQPLLFEGVPGAGLLWRPHAEVHFGRGSRANSLGFLDREPPAADRAAESCHVTFIGDSFVEARQVAIADKVQVRLEELAARERPDVDVTTSAFGFSGTGQISQLAFYDVFARGLSPDVVALVAVYNDFADSSLPLQMVLRGFHPDYPPHLFARRGAGGEMEFIAPAADRDFRENSLSGLPPPPEAPRVERELRARSYLANRLFREYVDPRRRAWGQMPELLRELNRRAALVGWHPSHVGFSAGWREEDLADPPYTRLFLEGAPPPAFREALDVMRFALDQFRERAERDGAALIILASHTLGGEGDPGLELLRGLAGDIPVISQSDYVVGGGGGGEIEDLHWAHDFHWNPTGHQRAAEAVWEWMKRHPEVCD